MMLSYQYWELKPEMTADSLYQFLAANGISKAFLHYYQQEFDNTPLSAPAAQLLTQLNKAKTFTPQVIAQAFGPSSRLSLYLTDLDGTQNNILHMLFSLLIAPIGYFQTKYRDEIPRLVNELFITLVYATTNAFSPFYKEIFSLAFSRQTNSADYSAFDILMQSNAFQILFISQLLDQKRYSQGSSLNFLHYGIVPTSAPHLNVSARLGNFESICVLQAFHYNPNVAYDKTFPLINAMSSDSPFAIHATAALLCGSADPNLRYESTGKASLHYLSFASAPFVFTELFSQFKADFQVKDAYGNSLLYTAAENNNLYAVQALCQHGAIDFANNRGETALMVAVRNKNISIVIELLQKGRSSVNSVTVQNQTVCDFMDCTDLELVRILFGAGMKVSKGVKQKVQRLAECEQYMREYAKTIKKIGQFKQTNIVQLDSFSGQCFICQEQFSLLKRRSHCRVCGKIVCRSCYVMKLFKDAQGKSSKYKVCMYCKNVSKGYVKGSYCTIKEVENLVNRISKVYQTLQRLIYQYYAKEQFDIRQVFTQVSDVFTENWEQSGWKEVGELVV